MGEAIQGKRHYLFQLLLRYFQIKVKCASYENAAQQQRIGIYAFGLKENQLP